MEYICRGLFDKLNSNEFISIISAFDIICLCETWSSINDCFSLQGYEQIDVKGGGINNNIVIIYKNSFHCKLSVEEN